MHMRPLKGKRVFFMDRRTYTNKGLALVLGLLLVLGLFSGCGEKPSGSAGESGSVKNITLQVVHRDESVKDFEIATDKENLRQALEDEGLIKGEESEFGLFVKTVDGETADDSKQEWWCLTKGGETWNNGVDSTEIADGDAFEFTLTTGY